MTLSINDTHITQHKNTAIMLVLRFIYYYAECSYAECHYAESRYDECRYAECRGVVLYAFR